MKNEQNIGFADFLTAKRKIKQEFFNQVNLIVDWRPISDIINENYSKGTSKTGRPSYDGLILFKMSLLQTWYGLSDYEVEDRVNDSISFSRFVGIKWNGTRTFVLNYQIKFFLIYSLTIGLLINR
jgi:IS5 family transposase